MWHQRPDMSAVKGAAHQLLVRGEAAPALRTAPDGPA
jgi:hypothetical protein